MSLSSCSPEIHPWFHPLKVTPSGRGGFSGFIPEGVGRCAVRPLTRGKSVWTAVALAGVRTTPKTKGVATTVHEKREKTRKNQTEERETGGSVTFQPGQCAPGEKSQLFQKLPPVGGGPPLPKSTLKEGWWRVCTIANRSSMPPCNSTQILEWLRLSVLAKWAKNRQKFVEGAISTPNFTAPYERNEQG